MNRRDSVKNIIFFSSAFYLLPGCQFESFKSYENLPLEKNQFRLIRHIMTSILPKEKGKTSTADDALDFLMTRLNDCYPSLDVQNYLTGLTDFENYLSTSFEKSFKKLTDEERIVAIRFDNNSDLISKEAQSFINTTKDLSVEYLTKSEGYLTQYMDYEFVPGRYIACKDV